MKKVCLLVLCGAALAGGAGSAFALPEFAKGFEKKYIADSSTDSQKSLDAAFKAAKKCNVCHDPDKKDAAGMPSKKFRNPYGEALHKFVHKKDKKDDAKIQESLEKVESMKADPKGPTYGELLKQGKLPYGAK